MKTQVEQTGKWFYRGLWGVLVKWIRVPDHPPTLPTGHGETAISFQPSPGFLSYLKLQFWIFVVLLEATVWFTVIATAFAVPVLGAILFVPAAAVTILPPIVAFIALYLRFDTTWYVITSRSLRIRRGIWIIHETTITFENVQNIKIDQGPVQRFFGISNVLIETAGGGGASTEQAHGGKSGAAHLGLIEGVADAVKIRDLVLARLRQSQTAGLGDEADHHHAAGSFLKPEHLAILREIRDAARRLSIKA